MGTTLPHFAIRIPKELIGKLSYIARENGRSANKEIEQLIIKHVKDFEERFFEITPEDIERLKK
jgi:predicted DNA-binding protein